MNISKKRLFHPPRGLNRSVVATFLLSLALTASAAIPDTMRAARTDADGEPGAMKIETVEVPTPSETQVLIEVYAASSNPSNWRINTGMPAGGPPPGSSEGGPPGGAPMNAGGPPGGGPGGPGGLGGPRRVSNPGNDVSGVVVAVGSAVSKFKVGDSVVAALHESGGGAYAEYAVANEEDVAYKSKNMSYLEAAGIPTAGFTAMRMALFADIQPGDRVLVIGAAGGVGSTAVQVAKAKGATVISSASSNHNDYLEKLGVDELINYDKEDVAAKATDIDIVINPIGSQNEISVSYPKRGGKVVVLGNVDQASCEAAGVTCINGGPGQGPSLGELMAMLSELADQGKYRIEIEKEFTLDQINEAHEFGRSGSREGKIAIAIGNNAKTY